MFSGDLITLLFGDSIFFPWDFMDDCISLLLTQEVMYLNRFVCVHENFKSNIFTQERPGKRKKSLIFGKDLDHILDPKKRVFKRLIFYVFLMA